MGFCKNPPCHTVADRVILSRTCSYVSFRGPVPESRWIDLRVRAPYVSPADCVLAASCASLGFIPAQAGIGAIQCERTRATPEQSYFLLLWVKIGRLRNTKITGAGWSPLSHRDIFICTMTWIPGSGPGMTRKKCPRNDKGGGVFFILRRGDGVCGRGQFLRTSCNSVRW